MIADHGVETFVFLPLFAPKKKKKKPRTSFARRLKRQRKKLGDDEWHDGELESKSNL